MPRLADRFRYAVLVTSAFALVAVISGCARFNAAFGQQWIAVTFAPSTTVATARHVVSSCSHVPHLPLEGKVRSDTGQAGFVAEVKYNSVRATPAEMARLEQCLSRFPKIVQGFTQMDQGDSG